MGEPILQRFVSDDRERSMMMSEYYVLSVVVSKD
jgi:hypothetical protein